MISHLEAIEKVGHGMFKHIATIEIVDGGLKVGASEGECE